MCCVRVYILFIVLRKWGHQINWGTSDQWLLYINCLGYEPHRLHTTDHIQCVQNKIKWMIFSIIFYRPLMTGLLSILHIWYTYSDIISTVHFRRTSAACQATTRRSQRLCTTTMWRSNIFELIRKIRIKPPNNDGISWINLFCVSAWSFYPFLTQFQGWYSGIRVKKYKI